MAKLKQSIASRIEPTFDRTTEVQTDFVSTLEPYPLAANDSQGHSAPPRSEWPSTHPYWAETQPPHTEEEDIIPDRRTTTIPDRANDERPLVTQEQTAKPYEHMSDRVQDLFAFLIALPIAAVQVAGDKFQKAWQRTSPILRRARTPIIKIAAPVVDVLDTALRGSKIQRQDLVSDLLDRAKERTTQLSRGVKGRLTQAFNEEALKRNAPKIIFNMAARHVLNAAVGLAVGAFASAAVVPIASTLAAGAIWAAVNKTGELCRKQREADKNLSWTAALRNVAKTQKKNILLSAFRGVASSALGLGGGAELKEFLAPMVVPMPTTAPAAESVIKTLAPAVELASGDVNAVDNLPQTRQIRATDILAGRPDIAPGLHTPSVVTSETPLSDGGVQRVYSNGIRETVTPILPSASMPTPEIVTKTLSSDDLKPAFVPQGALATVAQMVPTTLDVPAALPEVAVEPQVAEAAGAGQANVEVAVNRNGDLVFTNPTPEMLAAAQRGEPINLATTAFVTDGVALAEEGTGGGTAAANAAMGSPVTSAVAVRVPAPAM